MKNVKPTLLKEKDTRDDLPHYICTKNKKRSGDWKKLWRFFQSLNNHLHCIKPKQEKLNQIGRLVASIKQFDRVIQEEIAKRKKELREIISGYDD
jgi:uncharacterized protein YbgA (DUF1722 family)